MTRPTVSIVVPSYNQGAFLERALRSLVDQRAQIHELIVMDGGSTDDSRAVIERFAPQLTHWQSEPDNGQADAIKRGFERATGDILTWINSDDALLPGAVETARRLFERHPSVGLIEGSTVVVDEHDRIKRCDRRHGPSHRWARLGYMRIHQPSTFFRRELYERVGSLDDALHCTMDTDLWYRILPETKTRRVRRYIGVHRVHDEAKGESDRWRERYASERALLDERYPHYRDVGHLRYQTGRVLLNAAKVLHPGVIRARRDTERYSGATLSEAISRGLVPRTDEHGSTS